MKDINIKTVKVGLRLPEELRDDLKASAEAKGLKLSTHIRNLLQEAEWGEVRMEVVNGSRKEESPRVKELRDALSTLSISDSFELTFVTMRGFFEGGLDDSVVYSRMRALIARCGTKLGRVFSTAKGPGLMVIVRSS